VRGSWLPRFRRTRGRDVVPEDFSPPVFMAQRGEYKYDGVSLQDEERRGLVNSGASVPVVERPLSGSTYEPYRASEV